MSRSLEHSSHGSMACFRDQIAVHILFAFSARSTTAQEEGAKRLSSISRIFGGVIGSFFCQRRVIESSVFMSDEAICLLGHAP